MQDVSREACCGGTMGFTKSGCGKIHEKSFVRTVAFGSIAEFLSMHYQILRKSLNKMTRHFPRKK